MPHDQHATRLLNFAWFICALLQCLTVSGNVAGSSLSLFDIEFLFVEQETQLQAHSLESLNSFTKRLRKLDGVLSIRIVGHTDNSADQDTSKRISQQRADSIRTHLEPYFPTANFVSLGAGSSTPIADNRLLSGRTRNHRVEVQVIGTGAAVAAR